MGRRHPGPVPRTGAMDPLTAIRKIEEYLNKLREGFGGHPAPHAATHLQGGTDALATPTTPATIDPNLGASVGTATMYALANVRPAIDLKLTTKGDSLTKSATSYVREAVGADNTIHVAQASEATGRFWRTVAQVLGILLTAKGDIVTRDATTVVRKAVGSTNGMPLTVDATEADGLRYGPKVLRPAQITADPNDYAPGACNILFLSSDADRIITGAVAGTHDGQSLQIWNVGAFAIILAHANGGSAAANQFACHGGADVTINPGFSATLTYDLTAARWRAREE